MTRSSTFSVIPDCVRIALVTDAQRVLESIRGRRSYTAVVAGNGLHLWEIPGLHACA